jgi:tetratricopeptide (TPR) repeat protein
MYFRNRESNILWKFLTPSIVFCICFLHFRCFAAENNSVEKLYSQGVLHASSGDYKKAIECFEKVVYKDVRHIEAWFQIGLCSGKIELWDSAIAAYKQVIQFKPGLVSAHYNLGIAYIMAGNKSLAFTEYKILKDMDKNLANDLYNLIYR